MAHARCGEPNSQQNALVARLSLLSASSETVLGEREIEEWDAADTAQRLIELDNEARAHLSSEEYAESSARFATVWAQHEERALARYRALRNRNESDVNQESSNRRTRPLDSQFGSDGNQYNPYAPLTSEEYMMQEIEAGRMVPEMMDIPRHSSEPAQLPSSGHGPTPLLVPVHAGGRASWTAPRQPPISGQGLNGPGAPIDVSVPRGAPWSQHSDDGNLVAEDFYGEERPSVYPAMLPNLDIGGSSALQSPYGSAANPVFPDQESSFGIQSRLASSLVSQNLDRVPALGVPQQPHPTSTETERKRLTKRSLVVKLKTRRFPQAPASVRRDRSNASSSGESSSAAQTTQNSRLFNLRPRGSVGSTNARTRPGWEPQAVRRLTRKVETLQSPYRKRRRDAVSPQAVDTQGTTMPTAGPPQSE